MPYPAFLSWATPGPDGLAASGGDRGATAGSSHHREGLAASFGDGRGGERRQEDATEGLKEDEAELKVRTAIQRMGADGVSRAREEFERMDPGGRRGGVHEEELIEVSTIGEEREGNTAANESLSMQ